MSNPALISFPHRRRLEVVSAALIAVFLAWQPIGLLQSVEFAGRLEPELVPGIPVPIVELKPAQGTARQTLGALAAPADTVFEGKLLTFGRGNRPVFLVSDRDSVAVVTDADGNNIYAAAERVQMAKTNDKDLELAATLRLLTPGAAFATYPVRVGLRAADLDALRVGSAGKPVMLSISMQTYADGLVQVDGRPLKTRVVVDGTTFAINPSQDYQYMDVNRDGQFDTEWPSLEIGVAHGAPLVFHIDDGARYVSIARIDASSKTITLSARTAADYGRVEVRPGRIFPDFSYQAIDGSVHRLSDYQGKYVLLDFWGTWCPPCVADVPLFKKLLNTYRAKGFEILGMDDERGADDAADALRRLETFVATHGITWPQSRTASTRELSGRLLIFAWPTKILIDPKGTVVFAKTGMSGQSLEDALAAAIK
jgi:thiol-disulfide isomerase/thioredoxin